MVVSLSDDEWAVERNAAAIGIVGMSADEFVTAFLNGAFDDDCCEIMGLLMLFPELDN